MKRYEWSKLNHLQIGRYAEYFVKMEFTMFGFGVYSAEVDDKGIDFVVRRDPNRYYDVQGKSQRSFPSYKFMPKFMPKDRFELRPGLLLAVVLFREGEPLRHYLIPAAEWARPNALLVDRLYEGRKCTPE